jgi:predicted lysophospholipase L1 biosynthesis ABC-type transport system permease subunit
MVDYEDLKSTGLLSFGSRANEQVLSASPTAAAALARDLRQSLRDQFVNVRSHERTEDQIGEDLSVPRTI